MILGINASRARSGGAKAHLVGILTEGDPTRNGFREVHVWSYPELLDTSPSKPWLVKHSPGALEGSIFRQLWWERFSLSKELQRAGCSILLNVDAGTVCRYRPAVTMSRDMLSYEPGEIERFGFSKARLRLVLRRYMQNRSLRASEGAIFLTRYAAKVIQQSCGQLQRMALIPHGIGTAFTNNRIKHAWPVDASQPIHCLYVSNVAPYKHQWHVVRAIEILRKKGFDLQLILTGGGNAGAASKAQRTLDSEIRASDPAGLFTRQLGFVPQHELPQILANAHLFVFASSCENMPNTLMEAMAVGLPIACSNRGPMPEVLDNGGVYFDPENPHSIAEAIEQIITRADIRTQIAVRAKVLSGQYSWAHCANETFAFLAETSEASRK
jgi:glycosyltransferase involved in cell wall biosynthesis